MNGTTRRDGNFVPIQGINSLIAEKTIAFDGASGNGAVGSVALFTVTGTVVVMIIGACTESLASGGGGTIEVGVSGFTNGSLGNRTATNIDAGHVWVNDDLNFMGNIANHRATQRNIIATIGTGDITDGTITFYCFWYPLSADGNVVAA